MQTVAVISRIAESDLPFYKQWLEYYNKIGIDHFYIFGNSDLVDLEFLKQDNITYILNTGYDSESKFIGSYISTIKQDFTLLVDADEYIVIPENNIKNILYKGDYFFFPWFMSCSPTIQYKNLYEQSLNVKGFYLNQGKSMARTSTINSVFNNHHFNSPGTKGIRLPGCYTYHFRFRGIYDILQKCIVSEGYTQWHNKDKEKLERFLIEDNLDLKDIPNRIILAIAEAFCKNEKIIQPLPIQLSELTDNNYIEVLKERYPLFDKKYNQFLIDYKQTFKEFEFKKTGCKASLIEFLNKNSYI